MSRAQLRLATPPPQSWNDVTILTVVEFGERLKISTRSAYRLAAELPPGCVLHVRHGVRVLWEPSIAALAGEDPHR